MAAPRDVTGIASPWPDLDRATTGIHPGEMWIVAGRPSSGKSVLGLQWAAHAAAAGRAVLFASVEMSAEMCRQRLVACEARVPLRWVRTGRTPHGEDLAALVERVVGLTRTHRASLLDLRPMAGATPADVRAAALADRAAWGRLDLVVVDYVQLLAAPRSMPNREQETAAKSAALKALAGELGCGVLALAQLNREVERTSRRPRMSDLRESGALEQDADLVALVHRPGGKESPAMEVCIDKQRNGEPGIVHLHLDGARVRAESVERGAR